MKWLLIYQPLCSFFKDPVLHGAISLLAALRAPAVFFIGSWKKSLGRRDTEAPPKVTHADEYIQKCQQELESKCIHRSGRFSVSQGRADTVGQQRGFPGSHIPQIRSIPGH